VGELELIQNLELTPHVFDSLEGRHFADFRAQKFEFSETTRFVKLLDKNVIACGAVKYSHALIVK
jgi:hypothetical protein